MEPGRRVGCIIGLTSDIEFFFFLDQFTQAMTSAVVKITEYDSFCLDVCLNQPEPLTSHSYSSVIIACFFCFT